MYKLLALAIAFVAYAPQSAFATEDLQQMYFVLQNMTEANVANYSCIPSATNDGNYTYVKFQTTLPYGTDPDQVYYNMTVYMAEAVGDALSYYDTDSTGSIFTLYYIGDYNPYLLPPGPLKSLGRVLQKYKYPLLGTYTCSYSVNETYSGWIWIGINVPSSGQTYVSDCTNVYNYLFQNKLLNNSSSKISYNPQTNTGFLELWADL